MTFNYLLADPLVLLSSYAYPNNVIKTGRTDWLATLYGGIQLLRCKKSVTIYMACNICVESINNQRKITA